MDSVESTLARASVALRAVGEIRGRFFVPPYQRGYRWGAHEVACLLNDLWESPDDEVYCLQPVVVRPRDAGDFELVDGQQRLTTLFILDQYMFRAGLVGEGARYSITYETRPRSEEFLRGLPGGDASRNIDFFHMAGAHACVAAWFDEREAAGSTRAAVAARLRDKLARRVQVIWYEAPEGVDAATLFTRLNVGRIPLTNAELLKAVLLARVGAGGLARPEEVAAQWDGIERDLRDLDLWSFLSNDDPERCPARIELLFELLAEEVDPRRRRTYLVFDQLRARCERDREAFWREVLGLHATLREWYEDHDLYHDVGFLLADRGATLRALWDEARGLTRSQFGADLRDRIRRRVGLSPSQARELQYDKDPTSCFRVLLLANVETVRHRKPERFSFRLHKGVKWSLEHVHPQSGDAVRTTRERLQWLSDHRAALEGLRREAAPGDGVDAEDCERLIRDIDVVTMTMDIDGPTFDDLAGRVNKVFASGEPTELHGIGNLALLASNDNSALGNAVFDVKRRRVLARDREGQFIPICTLRLFLKYYSDAGARRLHFWGKDDREGYLDAMFRPGNGLLSGWLAPEEAR